MATEHPAGTALNGLTRFFVVPHTHWDREWYVPFEEFQLRLAAVVDEVIDVLESDPSFPCFTLKMLVCLMFLVLPSFALLMLTTLTRLPPPSHPLLILCSEDFFRVTERLGKIIVIALPEIWEWRHGSGSEEHKRAKSHV